LKHASDPLTLTLTLPVQLPVFAMYLSITNYYRTVARELKRLDSLSRSPIFAHFSETLGGLPVIRSFLRQRLYRRQNEVKLDDNVSAYYAMKTVDRWLSVRLEVLGNTIVFISALLAVFSASRAGPAGISLNNALSVTTLMNWAVRNGAETESIMNSVERVLYTTTQTPQEGSRSVTDIPAAAYLRDPSPTPSAAVPAHASAAPAASVEAMAVAAAGNASHMPVSDAELVGSGWPWRGGITFSGVRMRYREDMEPVLRGVTLQIQPGASIGIVGRTGSGKSSLLRALLRLTEVESGSVAVDGVDVACVGLDALRSGVSIIPQV
jgi:ABC-type multidrug transport system fused ATPase/permease subunit